MKDEDLLRYSRQIMMAEIGYDGQEALQKTTMMLVGLGGLGSPSSLYLAAAGVGHLIIVDFDKVEISNLQRQIIHNTKDIGKEKVVSAEEKIKALNPNTKITRIHELKDSNIDELVSLADVVLDGTDNFSSRFKINKACVENKTPLVSAAVIRMEGQVATFKGYEDDQACYRCLYSDDTNQDENCTDNGVLAPVAGMIGSIQALQAIKVVLNIGEELVSSVLMIDAFDLTFNKVKISKDANCPECKK